MRRLRCRELQGREWIGGVYVVRSREIQHGLGSDVEVIAVQQVNEAWDRVVASDVKYRFVIDTASLEG